MSAVRWLGNRLRRRFRVVGGSGDVDGETEVVAVPEYEEVEEDVEKTWEELDEEEKEALLEEAEEYLARDPTLKYTPEQLAKKLLYFKLKGRQEGRRYLASLTRKEVPEPEAPATSSTTTLYPEDQYLQALQSIQGVDYGINTQKSIAVAEAEKIAKGVLKTIEPQEFRQMTKDMTMWQKYLFYRYLQDKGKISPYTKPEDFLGCGWYARLQQELGKNPWAELDKIKNEMEVEKKFDEYLRKTEEKLVQQLVPQVQKQIDEEIKRQEELRKRFEEFERELNNFSQSLTDYVAKVKWYAETRGGLTKKEFEQLTRGIEDEKLKKALYATLVMEGKIKDFRGQVWASDATIKVLGKEFDLIKLYEKVKPKVPYEEIQKSLKKDIEKSLKEFRKMTSTDYLREFGAGVATSLTFGLTDFGLGKYSKKLEELEAKISSTAESIYPHKTDFKLVSRTELLPSLIASEEKIASTELKHSRFRQEIIGSLDKNLQQVYRDLEKAFYVRLGGELAGVAIQPLIFKGVGKLAGKLGEKLITVGEKWKAPGSGKVLINLEEYKALREFNKRISRSFLEFEKARLSKPLIKIGRGLKAFEGLLLETREKYVGERLKQVDIVGKGKSIKFKYKTTRVPLTAEEYDLFKKIGKVDLLVGRGELGEGGLLARRNKLKAVFSVEFGEGKPLEIKINRGISRKFLYEEGKFTELGLPKELRGVDVENFFKIKIKNPKLLSRSANLFAGGRARLIQEPKPLVDLRVTDIVGAEKILSKTPRILIPAVSLFAEPKIKIRPEAPRLPSIKYPLIRATKIKETELKFPELRLPSLRLKPAVRLDLRLGSLRVARLKEKSLVRQELKLKPLQLPKIKPLELRLEAPKIASPKPPKLLKTPAPPAIPLIPPSGGGVVSLPPIPKIYKYWTIKHPHPFKAVREILKPKKKKKRKKAKRKPVKKTARKKKRRSRRRKK